MSELNAAAALVLEVDTTKALPAVLTLDQALKGLGTTGLAGTAKDLDQFKSRIEKLEGSLSGAHGEIAKLRSANAQLSGTLKTTSAELDAFKKSVSGIGAATLKSSVGVQQAVAHYGGYTNAYRKATAATKDHTKALSDEGAARRAQLSQGNDIVAMLRRQRAEQTALGSFTRSAQYREDLAAGDSFIAALRRQADAVHAARADALREPAVVQRTVREDRQVRVERPMVQQAPTVFTRTAAYQDELAAGSSFIAGLRRQTLEERRVRAERSALGKNVPLENFSSLARFQDELAAGNNFISALRRQTQEVRQARIERSTQSVQQAPALFSHTAQYQAELTAGNGFIAALRRQTQDERQVRAEQAQVRATAPAAAVGTSKTYAEIGALRNASVLLGGSLQQVSHQVDQFKAGLDAEPVRSKVMQSFSADINGVKTSLREVSPVAAETVKAIAGVDYSLKSLAKNQQTRRILSVDQNDVKGLERAVGFLERVNEAARLDRSGAIRQFGADAVAATPQLGALSAALTRLRGDVAQVTTNKLALKELKFGDFGLDSLGTAKINLVGRIKETFKAAELAVKAEAAASVAANKLALKELKFADFGLDSLGTAKINLVGRIKETFKAAELAVKADAANLSRSIAQAMKAADIDRSSLVSSLRGDRQFVRLVDTDLDDVKNMERLVRHLQDVKSLMANTTPSVAIEKYGKDAVEATAKLDALERQLNETRAAMERLNARSKANRLAEIDVAFETAKPKQQLATATHINALRGKGVDDEFLNDKFGGSAIALAGNATAIAALNKQIEEGETKVARASKAMGQFSKSQWEAHAAARGLAGSLGQLWMTYGSLVPLAAGAAIGASFREVIRVGKEVEHQLTFVAALGGDSIASTVDFANAVKGSMFGLTEAAGGMRAMAQSGLNTKQALDQLPGVLKLATVGEMTVAEAAYAATGVMHAFNLEVADMGRVGDVFAKAAAVSNTSVKGMMEAMRQASTVADLYGVSLEETAAGLAVMAKRNIEGSAAGTAFRNAMNELATPIKAAKLAMDAINFNAFDEGTKKLKPLPQVLEELQVQLSDLDEKSRLQFLDRMFGERGAKAVNAILSDMQEFNRTLTQMKDASSGLGFVAEVVTELEGTLSGKLKGLLGDFERSVTKVYDNNKEALKGLVDQLRNLVTSQGFIDFLNLATKALTTLTQAVLNNIDAIKVAVLAYAGLKITSAVSADLGNLAKSFGTVAGSAATAAGGFSSFLGKAGMVTGWLGVAVGLITPVYIAWQEYANRVSDAEKANKRFVDNTTSLANSLDMERQRLVKSNDELARRIDLLRQGKSEVEATARSKVGGDLDARKAQKAALDKDIAALQLGVVQTRGPRGIVVTEDRQRLARAGFSGLNDEENKTLSAVLAKYKGGAKSTTQLLASLVAESKTAADAIAGIERSTTAIVADNVTNEARSKLAAELGKLSAQNEQFRNIAKKRGLDNAEISSLILDPAKLGSDPAAVAEAREAAYEQARQRKLIVSQDLPSTTHKDPVDRSAIQDVTSIGKQAELEFQAESKRIDLRERAAQILQKNELINEKAYQDLQNELSQARITAAEARIKAEQAEIDAARKKPGINAATTEALDRKQGELNARSQALKSDTEVKRLEDAIDRYGDLQGAALAYKKTLGGLREESALTLEAKQREFDLAKIADPVKLAGLQAELEVTGRYNDALKKLNAEIVRAGGENTSALVLNVQTRGDLKKQLADIDAEIDAAEGDPEKLAVHLKVKSNLEEQIAKIDAAIVALGGDPIKLSVLITARSDLQSQLESDKGEARARAEAWEQESRTFEHGWSQALKKFRTDADNAATTGERVFTTMAQSAQQSFADFLFNPFDKGLKGMLQGFLTMLQRMIAEAVAADLARKLVGSPEKGGSDGWISLGLQALGLFSGGGSAGGSGLSASAGGQTGITAGGAGSGFTGGGGQGLKLKFATGGAFDEGIQKFATGGAFTNTVVTQPTPFRFAKGAKMGEMGEAGPEAIMPLTRMANGKLGVASAGGGGPVVNLTVNVASGTPSEVKRAAGAGAREALSAYTRSQRYG